MVNYPTTPKHSVLVEDVSDALTLTGTQTIKYLYKITSPNGTIIYKNAGYDTDTYTTSDKGTSVTYNLPLTTSGEPEAGAYIIYVKAQFADSAFPLTDFTTSKTTTTSELCMCDVKTISINLSYDVLGNPSTFTSTDTTDYSGSLDYYALSRTHTVRPPLASGLSNLVGTSTTLVYSSIWTGSWESMVQSYVTYRGFNSNDSTYSYFTYYCVGSDSEIVVSDSVLCKMYCGLKSLEAQVAASVGRVKEDFVYKLNLGNAEMFLALQSFSCDDTEKLDYFVERFYAVTGLDPNCDCCGSDEGSAPIINSTTVLGFTVGTVTTGSAAVTITGSYPNYTFNFVIPAGGGASTITPEPYVLDETIVAATDTTFQLYYTGTAGHYAIKEQNQIWTAVPAFNAGITGNVKYRRLHNGRIHVKGWFTFPTDLGAVDKTIFPFPTTMIPAESALDTRVKNLVKYFVSETNSSVPSLASGGFFCGVKKALGQTDFSLTVQAPLGTVLLNPSYMFIDDILDITENVSVV